MLQQYFVLFLFALVALAFGVGVLFFASLVRNRDGQPDPTPYECGMEPVGSPWVSPNIRFYVFALVFVIFDAEALFVFPWAVNMREFGWMGLWELLVFVGIVFVGLIYAWRRGALRWE